MLYCSGGSGGVSSGRLRNTLAVLVQSVLFLAGAILVVADPEPYLQAGSATLMLYVYRLFYKRLELYW